MKKKITGLYLCLAIYACKEHKAVGSVAEETKEEKENKQPGKAGVLGNSYYEVDINNDFPVVDTYAAHISGKILPLTEVVDNKWSVKLVTTDPSPGTDKESHVYDFSIGTSGNLISKWISIAYYRLEITDGDKSFETQFYASPGNSYFINVKRLGYKNENVISRKNQESKE